MAQTQFLLEEYLQELEKLVNIDSGSRDPEGTGKIAAYFAERFTQLGWQVQLHATDPSVGPCLQVTNSGQEPYDMLLIGHMDTVFTKGTAAERPFAVREGRAYGPGVVDMKASLLSAYYALRQLQAEGALDGTSICLAFNSDEEISSRYSRAWIESLAVKSRCAIVLEPARADGSMVNTRRGVGRYTITCKGVPSHTGIAPEKGVSAINELAHWILGLHGLTDYAKGTNVNVGVIKGGTTPNTVAEDAVAEVDVRMTELAEAARVQQAIETMLQSPRTPGIKVSVSGGVTRPPMQPSAQTLALCERVDAVAKRVGVEFAWIATGGGSDANLTAALGVPSIDGFGPVGGLSHTVDEYMEVTSVEPRLALLREVIRDFAGGVK